jgi:hypothetical protein
MQCFRSGFSWISGSGLLSGSQSRKAKMTHKKRNKIKKLYFEVVIALFGRAGRLSFCSFEVLHGDLR